MSFVLKIDNQFLPSGVKVESKSLNISYDETGTRGVLSFNLIDENLSGNLFYFQSVCGKDVKVWENGILIYGGKIDTPDIEKINQKPKTHQSITCVDYNEICDRRLVNESYPKLKISDLIKDVIDKYLTDDGIWYDDDSIDETLNEISVNCPYVYCSTLFNELVELIGWQWYIDANKKFYLDDRTINIGPQIIENTNYLWGSLKIGQDISELRNKQILKDVKAVTDELIEVANPNPDDNRSYYVRFKLNNKPKIYITIEKYKNNPRDQDLINPIYVGINGLDSDMYWYWSKNENTITQDQDQEALTEGQFLVLKYFGQYSIDIVKEDENSINERKSIEGGSGLYESVESGANIEGILIGEEKAQALLNRYSSIADKITLSSYKHNWKNGQICDTIFPSFGINSLTSEGGGFLVRNLKIEDVGNNLPFLRSATFVNGTQIGGFINFFKEWMAKTKEFTLREDSLVEKTLDYNEEQEWSGTVVITKFDCLYPEDDPGGLHPSNLLFPGTIDTTRTEYD